MKIRSIDLDEETEEPDRFVCVLTRSELALIYRLTGHLSEAAVNAALGATWGDVLTEIAGCSGNAFNRFYEDGVDDVMPRWRGGIQVS